MKFKIKIFSSVSDVTCLEEKVNNYLENELTDNEEVINFQYECTLNSRSHLVHTIILWIAD